MSTEAVTIQFATASHHLPGGSEKSGYERRYQYPGLMSVVTNIQIS